MHLNQDLFGGPIKILQLKVHTSKVQQCRSEGAEQDVRKFPEGAPRHEAEHSHQLCRLQYSSANARDRAALLVA